MNISVLKMSCKVRGCRFSTTHVTSFHQCGTCRMFGHGQVECNDREAIKQLQNHSHDVLTENLCQVENCTHKNKHTTSGHCCPYCGKRDNAHMKQCPSKPGNSTDVTTDPTSIAFDPQDYAYELNLPVNTYTYFDAGMGCTWIVRNNRGKLEYFFLHSDSCGQYGEDTSDIPKVNAFTDGYRYIHK